VIVVYVFEEILSVTISYYNLGHISKCP